MPRMNPRQAGKMTRRTPLSLIPGNHRRASGFRDYGEIADPGSSAFTAVVTSKLPQHQKVRRRFINAIPMLYQVQWFTRCLVPIPSPMTKQLKGTAITLREGLFAVSRPTISGWQSHEGPNRKLRLKSHETLWNIITAVSLALCSLLKNSDWL